MWYMYIKKKSYQHNIFFYQIEMLIFLCLYKFCHIKIWVHFQLIISSCGYNTVSQSSNEMKVAKWFQSYLLITVFIDLQSDHPALIYCQSFTSILSFSPY